jgi:hypothetical protein
MLTLDSLLKVLRWRQSYGDDIGPIPRDRLPASHYVACICHEHKPECDCTPTLTAGMSK